MGEGVTDIDLAELGQEIRRRRQVLGWTLDQFAEACKLTPNYLGTIENGKRDPHMSTLTAIARALGCRIADLIPDPGTDLSPAALEVGRMFDNASPEAKDAAERTLRVLVNENDKDDKDKDKGQEKRTHLGREGGPSS
jgi:transcriptional regulator with XRE-family HTH domain